MKPGVPEGGAILGAPDSSSISPPRLCGKNGEVLEILDRGFLDTPVELREKLVRVSPGRTVLESSMDPAIVSS